LRKKYIARFVSSNIQKTGERIGESKFVFTVLFKIIQQIVNSLKALYLSAFATIW